MECTSTAWRRTTAPTGPRAPRTGKTIVVLAPELDVDGDGMANGWESDHFGSPTGAVADADSDGDGFSIWANTWPDPARTIEQLLHRAGRHAAGNRRHRSLAVRFQSDLRPVVRHQPSRHGAALQLHHLRDPRRPADQPVRASGHHYALLLLPRRNRDGLSAREPK